MITKPASINLAPVLLLLSFIGFTGCAHSQMNESVNEKLKEQTPVASGRDFNVQAENTIQHSRALNEGQKNQLLDLFHQTHLELLQNSDDSLKLRELLISEIAQPNYSDDEVGVIKERLKKAEDKKLSLIFDAVDKANKILGHNPDRNRQILRVFSGLPVEAL